MNPFEGKNILIGVTGGIAAFKVASLVSSLVKLGADVKVIMTENATQFVSPLTFQTLSRHPVYTHTFGSYEWRPEHIALADEADLFLVAPATANIIGKIANGIADDLLTTVAMAIRCSAIIAPSMNTNMFDNPVVQRNIRILAQNGWSIISPDTGMLACGYEGRGRLPDTERIIEILEIHLTEKDFAGARVLVTAGPTRERIDPVRFITNPSSGKMGYAVARAARNRGAEVTLITGPTTLPRPDYVEVVDVESADEMHEVAMAKFEQSDIVIMAAAVADYRPVKQAEQKIKKTGEILTLELERTPDILAEMGASKGDRILVGFAAETEMLVSNAYDKLIRKNLDLIVANNVTEQGAGFESDTNIVTMIDRSGKAEKLPKLSKDIVAHKVLDKVLGMIRRESSTEKMAGTEFPQESATSRQDR